ncbi:hypothetical protein LTR60_000867 [Cryomyces antarcticus]|nr:hypothetical protein LTR39_003695 [Cryomyces antarcticus]KAK5020074.1 hypothetical protein LTR60_000867 [Cryomyces antarcticus]
MLAQINILRASSTEGLNNSISSWFRYDHMKRDLQSLENGATSTMAETLELIAEDQRLEDLVVLLPGRDGGDMWDVKNDSVYFAEETFSRDNINGRAAIVDALSKIVGLKKLTIGYTHDHGLAEAVARSTGAEEVAVRADEWLGITPEERNDLEARGWSINNMEARKALLPDVVIAVPYIMSDVGSSRHSGIGLQSEEQICAPPEVRQEHQSEAVELQLDGVEPVSGR